jgi:hypothetical protein
MCNDPDEHGCRVRAIKRNVERGLALGWKGEAKKQDKESDQLN